MASANGGMPQNPIVYTDNVAGTRVFIGTTTPSNPVDGDVWIDSNPLNNAGKNLVSQATLSGPTYNFAVPNSYKDVCLVIRGLTASASANLTIILNSDTGSNYAGTVIGGTTITNGLFQIPLTGSVTTNGLILTLQDTQDTVSWQMARLEGNNGSTIFSTALYKTAVAISSITITASTGNLSGTALVYGVN